MKRVELYLKVRRAVMIDGLSRRSAAAFFGINRKTVDKMLVFPEPPQHGRSGRSFSGKLSGLTEIIDQILSDDRSVHAKQRHTGTRIFERLRDEHGFTGGITIVRDYVSNAKLRSREVFIPLSHKPGHAQVDFGEADGIIGGKLTRFHLCQQAQAGRQDQPRNYPVPEAIHRTRNLYQAVSASSSTRRCLTNIGASTRWSRRSSKR